MQILFLLFSITVIRSLKGYLRIIQPDIWQSVEGFLSLCNDEFIIELTEIPKLQTGYKIMSSQVRPVLMNPYKVYQSNKPVHDWLKHCNSFLFCPSKAMDHFFFLGLLLFIELNPY